MKILPPPGAALFSKAPLAAAVFAAATFASSTLGMKPLVQRPATRPQPLTLGGADDDGAAQLVADGRRGRQLGRRGLTGRCGAVGAE